jgi:hypothetical protein
MYAVPEEREGGGERGKEENKEGEREKKMQLYLLQFMTRESRALIPINCSVHETRENYADTRAIQTLKRIQINMYIHTQKV